MAGEATSASDPASTRAVMNFKSGLLLDVGFAREDLQEPPKLAACAGRHTRRVAPIRVPLGVPATLAEVLRAVRDDVRPFALTGDWAGSRAVVGSEPRRTQR